jgi:hypothetical protein
LAGGRAFFILNNMEELEAQSAITPEVEDQEVQQPEDTQEQVQEEQEEESGYNGTPFSELDEESKASALEELKGREELTEDEASFLKDNGVEVAFEGDEQQEETEESFDKPAYAEIIEGVTGQEFKSREEYDNAVADFLKRESETTTRLSEVLNGYPEVKNILSDLMNEENPNIMSILNKHIDLQEMTPEKGDEDYEAFVKAEVQRKLKAEKDRERVEQQKNNQLESTNLLKDFVKEKKLNPEQGQDFFGKVHQFVTDLNNGKVTKQYLEMLYNGANYGKDIESAKAQAEVKARNENILTVKRKKKGLAPNIKSNQKEAGERDAYGNDPFLRNLDSMVQSIR